MSDYNQSQDYEAYYLDRCGVTESNYFFESSMLKDVINSFYRCFIFNEKSKSVLHLGSRDGIIAQNLLEIDESISATLIDKSEDKVNKAKERLNTYKKNRYIRAELKEVIHGNVLEEKFDFIVSSLTIDHLSEGKKEELFNKLYSHLNRNGYFLNIDIMPMSSNNLLKSYVQLINQIEHDERIDSDKYLYSFKGGTEGYRKLNKVTFDTLYKHLDSLKEIGFKDVSCFYKFGNIAVYSGRK